jgi:hypothetical protein
LPKDQFFLCLLLLLHLFQLFRSHLVVLHHAIVGCQLELLGDAETLLQETGSETDQLANDVVTK